MTNRQKIIFVWEYNLDLHNDKYSLQYKTLFQIDLEISQNQKTLKKLGIESKIPRKFNVGTNQI